MLSSTLMRKSCASSFRNRYLIFKGQEAQPARISEFNLLPKTSFFFVIIPTFITKL